MTQHAVQLSDHLDLLCTGQISFAALICSRVAVLVETIRTCGSCLKKVKKKILINIWFSSFLASVGISSSLSGSSSPDSSLEICSSSNVSSVEIVLSETKRFPGCYEVKRSPTLVMVYTTYLRGKANHSADVAIEAGFHSNGVEEVYIPNPFHFSPSLLTSFRSHTTDHSKS